MYKLYFPFSSKTMSTTFVLTQNYSGFCLSSEALKELGWHKDQRYLVLEADARSDPELVRVCKKLGPRASEDGKPFKFEEVAIADIPFVTLSEYDGWESLTIDTNAKHRAAQEQIISATRAVLSCSHLSDTEKLSLITIILK